MLSINWAGTATANLTRMAVTTSTGITTNAIWENTVAIIGNSVNTGASGTGTTFNFHYAFTITAPPGTQQTLTLAQTGTLPASGQYCDLLLVCIDSNL